MIDQTIAPETDNFFEIKVALKTPLGYLGPKNEYLPFGRFVALEIYKNCTVFSSVFSLEM